MLKQLQASFWYLGGLLSARKVKKIECCLYFVIQVCFVFLIYELILHHFDFCVTLEQLNTKTSFQAYILAIESWESSKQT